MSAWPEAVWIVKKMNQVFDITNIIAENNLNVDELNQKLTTAQNQLNGVSSDASRAIQTINNTTAEFQALKNRVSTLENDITTLQQRLENLDNTAIQEALAAIERYKEDIDKQLVIIANNTGSTQQPIPRDIGENVAQYSVFLIQT